MSFARLNGEVLIVFILVKTVNEVIEPRPVAIFYIYSFKVLRVLLQANQNWVVDVIAFANIDLQVNYDDKENAEEKEGYDLPGWKSLLHWLLYLRARHILLFKNEFRELWTSECTSSWEGLIVPLLRDYHF